MHMASIVTILLSLKVVTSLSTALYRREDDNQGMDFLYPKGSRKLFYTIFTEAYIMIRISYISQVMANFLCLLDLGYASEFKEDLGLCTLVESIV